MLLKLNIVFFLVLGLFFNKSSAQESDYLAELEYEIEYEIELPKLKVKGFFVNNTTETFEAEYLLKVQKNSGSGKADSDQKGTFKSAPMEKIFLSESIMNISEDAEYNITLEIKNGLLTIAEKSINIKGQEF
ncbi:MAG: hypothetical protein EHM47_15270 [Ignavibacteriales bacterium]|nr:MAG: hypothetical protein EHM47_15270 [Ignavibacteriales bacterium]